MTAVDYTSTVLYHYLRALSVRVSRATVRRLLDTPVAGSMRSLSDALDALHVKNEVYQLPPSPDYFGQLEAPFVTMLQADDNPFCVVTKKDDSFVELGDSKRVEVNVFLKKWTGIVLLGEVSKDTPSDTYYQWKNVGYYLLKYKIAIVILLLIGFGVASAWQYNDSSLFISYLGTLVFGILVSVCILYKELINTHFLENFCHISKTIDCNKVLHSRGANIAGIGLGELSMFYFTMLFLFCTLFPNKFYGVAFLCGVIAFCFTIYSIIYQFFIIHKWCMLCMLVNVAVWASMIILCNGIDKTEFCFSLSNLFMLAIAGCICLMVGISLKSIYKDKREKTVLKQRMKELLNPEVFQSLLPLEAHIEERISTDIAIQNGKENSQHLMIVTNPNCEICAESFHQVEKIAEIAPVSLVVLAFPTDQRGQHVAQIVIAAYLAGGWQESISVLAEWYKNKRISKADKYPVTPEVERMWREQQEYCRKQGIDRTPVVIIDRHYMPKIYRLSELKYVLT